jgi:hypothetical protein
MRAHQAKKLAMLRELRLAYALAPEFQDEATLIYVEKAVDFRLAAISSHFLSGQRVPPTATTLFVAGSALGMIAGTHLGKRLSGQRLQ